MPIDNNKLTDIMNFVGYCLAKFDNKFIAEFGFDRKQNFYKYIVDLGLANSVSAVHNRMDSFDPYFDNGRKGWYQRNQREHIKLYIDSLFGKEDARSFANIVKLYIHDYNAEISFPETWTSPSIQSRFQQLQETGKEAECFFMNNYSTAECFKDGLLEDARLWGDGYDFQIKVKNTFFLTEVKGVKGHSGAIRMTSKEFDKALQYRNEYYLVVVSNLSVYPKLNIICNPAEALSFTPHDITSIQHFHNTEIIKW